MSTLFGLLFGVSLTALVIGLIKPSLFNKFFKGQANRKKTSLAFGIATLVFLILGSVTSPASPKKEVVTNTEEQQEEVSPVKFDVPSLIGKDINEIVAVLGTPNKYSTEPTEAQLKLGTTDWEKTYEKDGRELMITYNIQTRTVIDFFISATDKEIADNDKKGLLGVGGLKENDPTYSVEFVKQIVNPSKFTGIKITPNK